MPPLIALLTDFGLRDHYVGAMKGAVLSVCPEATLVDVVHEIPPHDVPAAALALDGAYRSFPPGTVFVTVVDPGVGSERRPLALGAGRWLFVGPDNGVFTFVLATHPAAHVRLLANPRLARGPLSAVFHGRDLFGPAVGWLARGLPLEETGPEIRDPVLLELARAERLPEPSGLRGTVIHVDRFGNLVTNLEGAELHALLGPDPGVLEVRLGLQALPVVRTYAEVGEGRPCALIGSTGRLEVAVNRGRAADELGASLGTPVEVRRQA